MTLTSIVSLAAKKVGISAALLLSVCTVETGLRNVNNYSDPYGGSFGICQVSLGSAREIKPGLDILSLMQPKINAEIAAKILKRKMQKYGMLLGIASYNSGSPKFNKQGDLINSAYCESVLDNLQKIGYN